MFGMGLTGRVRFAWLAVLAAVAAPMLGGCGSSPERMGRYTLVVTPAPGLNRQIEVDAVGVNEQELGQYRALSVDDYFTPGNATRSSASKQTMTFSASAPGSQQIASTDAVWTSWLGENTRRNDGGKGARSVVFVAAMERPEAATALDTRVLEVPLSQKRWNNGQRIEIMLTPAGLQLVSAMKPVEN